jgi:hypothetical protein
MSKKSARKPTATVRQLVEQPRAGIVGAFQDPRPIRYLTADVGGPRSWQVGAEGIAGIGIYYEGPQGHQVAWFAVYGQDGSIRSRVLSTSVVVGY